MAGLCEVASTELNPLPRLRLSRLCQVDYRQSRGFPPQLKRVAPKLQPAFSELDFYSYLPNLAGRTRTLAYLLRVGFFIYISLTPDLNLTKT